MHWTSWSEFWSMGGYGLYVWGSVGVTFAVLAGESLALRLRLKAAWRELALRRAARVQAASPSAAPLHGGASR